MSTEKKYKVIDYNLSVPNSPTERACSTNTNLTKKSSTSPGDYGFISIDDPFLSTMLFKGKSEVKCKQYTPEDDPRNFCYDTVGASKTHDIEDPLAPWYFDRIINTDYNAKIKLTEKYIIDGKKTEEVFAFEDCGIDPKDQELKINYYTANCLGEDKKDEFGFTTSSPCDKYLTECCNITPRKIYKYAMVRPSPSIAYDMNFDFLVTYSSSFKRCYLGSGCSKGWDRLQISQIEKLKEGTSIKMKRFVGNKGDVWWYMDIEIKRTNYKKVRPNERRPKITVTGFEKQGYTDLPDPICPKCNSDYSFTIEAISENVEKKTNETLSLASWDRVASYPNQKLDEGPFAGKTLIAASTGNDILLKDFSAHIDSTSRAWQNEVRSTPRDGIPNLSASPKAFKIRSVGYLKPNIKVKAKLLPKRTPEKSCFGCGSTWQFSTEKASFGGGPTP